MRAQAQRLSRVRLKPQRRTQPCRECQSPSSPPEVSFFARKHIEKRIDCLGGDLCVFADLCVLARNATLDWLFRAKTPRTAKTQSLSYNLKKRVEWTLMKHARRVFKNLFESGHAAKGLDHPVFLHRAQARRVEADLPDLLHGSLLQDCISDLGVGHQELVDSQASSMPGEVACRTPLAAPKRKLLDLVALQTKSAKHTIFRRVLSSAVRADFSHQPLRQHCPDRRCDQRSFNLHVDQAYKRAD